MNKNGFAISTLLYGISLMGVMIVILMMSVMATNRKNTSTMVKDIEEELNRLSLTNTTINTTGKDKAFVVPEKGQGWYKIQLWGASGTGGYGSYTSGIIYLDAGQNLFFDVGVKNGAGADTNTVAYITDDSNTDKNGKTIKNFTYIMRAMGNNGAGPDQSGTAVTTGNAIAGYPGVRLYKPGSAEYTLGNLYFEYKHFKVENDTKSFEGDPKYYAFLDPYMVSNVRNGDGKTKIEKISSNDKAHPPISLSSKATFSSVSVKQSISGINEVQALTYNTSNGQVTNGINSPTDADAKKAYDLNISTQSTLGSGTTKSYGCPSKAYYGVGIHHTNKASNTMEIKIGDKTIKTSGTEPAYGVYISLAKASAFGFLAGDFATSADYWISPASSPAYLLTSSSTNVKTALIDDGQNQKWHIEKVKDKNYYKIIETSKNHALRIDEVDEYGAETTAHAEANSKLSTDAAFHEPDGLLEERWTLELDDNDKRYFTIKSTSTTTRGNSALYLGIDSNNLVVKTSKTKFFLRNQSY